MSVNNVIINAKNVGFLKQIVPLVREPVEIMIFRIVHVVPDILIMDLHLIVKLVHPLARTVFIIIINVFLVLIIMY